MKKFIVMILGAATFFVGLGGLVEGVGARFKSDERALELIRLARQAVGGEQALANVKSLTIAGRATKTFDFDGAARSEQGDWELNLEMSGRFGKSMKLRSADAARGATAEVSDEVDIIVERKPESGDRLTVSPDGKVGEKKTVFVMKKDGAEKVIVDGEGSNVEARKILLDKGANIHEAARGLHQRGDLFRTTVALLLTAPEGVDVSYTYAGEVSVDGVSCDVVKADAAGSSFKLYLNKSSHLPVMVSYQAPKPFMIKISKDEARANVSGGDGVKILREKVPAPEMAEYQVRFSDFRTIGGLSLPHRWTQTVNGQADETIEISGYELNPANIAEKFNRKPEKVFFRTAKPQ
jgi:hypothetical protein